MLNEPTMDKLRALHLGAMASAWTAQREDPKSLSDFLCNLTRSV
jgi:hypothetical protein